MLDKYSMFHGWPSDNWKSFMCVYSRCYKFNPAKQTLQLYEEGLKVNAEVNQGMKAQKDLSIEVPCGLERQHGVKELLTLVTQCCIDCWAVQ